MKKMYQKAVKEWIIDEYLEGTSITELSERMNVHENTIRKWLYSFALDNPNPDYGIRLNKRIEKNNKLREQIFKETGKSPNKIYTIISQLEDDFSVTKMAMWLDVSESGYYKWKKLKRKEN